MLNNILGLLGLVAAVWVIYDVFTQNKALSNGMKVVWTVLALLFSLITAIVYYIMYKR